MDFLDSILNSMQKPPSASEAQKNAMKKEKEAIERKQKEQQQMLNRFRKRVEDKVAAFVKGEEDMQHLQFEPMEQVYRGIIREVGETAGLVVFSFGQEGVDRHNVVYRKERPPSEDELAARRQGLRWDDERAKLMAQNRIEAEKQQALDSEEASRKRKRPQQELSGTFYKDKYAHLIGQDAALSAAHKTNVNKSYGEVPSENKRDQRSIEQTMADLRAKRHRNNHPPTQSADITHPLLQNNQV